MINLKKSVTTPDTETRDVPFSEFQKPPQFPFLLRRMLEFLLASVICSVPIALLYGIGIIPKSDYWGIRIMGISLFAFVAINIYLLRAFYYSMGNKKIYYNVNITAYTLFAIINLAVFLIFKDDYLPSFYSFLFMPMKFVNVVLNMLGSTSRIQIQILAPLATHIFMLLIILAAPLEMYTFDKKKK